MSRLTLAILSFLYASIVFCSPVKAADIPQFQADYEIFYGDMRLGEGRYTLKKSQADNAYQFHFSSKLSFLIFSDKREVKSTFTYTNAHLLPSHYSHERRGSGPDYLDTINFDQKSKRITSTHKNKTIELNYDQTIRDGLTVQLQLMLDLQRGIKKVSYTIIDDNRVKVRKFTNLGMETIVINNRTYHCVKIEVLRRNSKRRTLMWFSPDHNHQPIQMTHFVNNKKKFNAHLINYTTLNTAGNKPPAKLAQDTANSKKKTSHQGTL